VLQCLYLWDKTSEGAPHWTDEKQPPKGYLRSGRHNDNVHGPDDLYAKLGDKDLFYGISYEDDPELQEFLSALQKIAEKGALDVETPAGLAKAVEIYEATFGKAPLDVTLYKAFFGGSSGWEQYTAYLQGQGAKWGEAVVKLNPDLPWAKDPAGLGCQLAMIGALSRGGSVRFLLDGMKDIKGILAGTAYTGKVTSNELRFTVALLDESIRVSEKTTVQPIDGVNVFFYLNRQLIQAEHVQYIGRENVVWLAGELANKIAEEEEWDEDDKEDLGELQELLAQLPIGHLMELLFLP
jgi:hypothetical protein